MYNQENYKNSVKKFGKDIKKFFNPKKNKKPSSNNCNYKLNSTELNCYKNNYPDLSALNNQQLQQHWTTTGCKQIRNNQCPNYQPLVGQYNYVGCFNDNKDIRAIQNFRGNVTSPLQCMQLANTNNDNVFGLQYNNQCYTSKDINSAKKYGQVFNKNNCPQMGGSLTNQVYYKTQQPTQYINQTPFTNTPIMPSPQMNYIIPTIQPPPPKPPILTALNFST